MLEATVPFALGLWSSYSWIDRTPKENGARSSLRFGAARTVLWLTAAGLLLAAAPAGAEEVAAVGRHVHPVAFVEHGCRASLSAPGGAPWRVICSMFLDMAAEPHFDDVSPPCQLRGRHRRPGPPLSHGYPAPWGVKATCNRRIV